MISMTAHFVPMLFGEGASLKTGLQAKKLGITKAIVIFDQGVRNAGVVDPIIKNLETLGIQTVLFDKVLPDPPDVIVDEAGELARSEKVDGIIAVGGGSSIDAAKGVNVLINNPSPINQWFAPKVPPGAGIPFIAIPTTAGTGSEGTGVAVITDTKAGKKGALKCPHCYADIAIVDPVLYVGLPAKATAACAFDVFTHAVDTICHIAPEVFATTYAEKAIRLTLKYLPRVLENGQDLEARGQMAFAASLGGYCINGAMCHLTHSVGHSLGSAFHIPHGLGCAICLPQLLELYAQWMPDRVKIVADAMGLSLPDNITNEELGKKTSAAALAFMKQSNLPTLKEMGYSLEEVYAMVPMMAKDMTVSSVPRMLPDSKFKEMITAAYDL